MKQDIEQIAFLRALRRLARALDLHSGRINRDSGLTLPQLIVLTCIRDLGSATGRAIALAADLSPPTVVGILDKLESKGLIVRHRSEEDRRSVHARLTARGADFLDRAPAPMGDGFARGLSALPAPERARMLADLERLVAMTGAPTVSNGEAGKN